MSPPLPNVMPDTLHASSLSASLTVSDLSASMAWYCDALGFTVERRYEREGVLASVSLAAGDVRVLLNADTGARGPDRVKGEGFSMMLTTSDPVDEIAARIRAHGGTLDSEPADMPWGSRVFRVRDPDGFRWAISSPRPTG